MSMTLRSKDYRLAERLGLDPLRFRQAALAALREGIPFRQAALRIHRKLEWGRAYRRHRSNRNLELSRVIGQEVRSRGLPPRAASDYRLALMHALVFRKRRTRRYY